MLESLLFFSTISLIKLSILAERVFSYLRSGFVCHVECADKACAASLCSVSETALSFPLGTAGRCFRGGNSHLIPTADYLSFRYLFCSDNH